MRRRKAERRIRLPDPRFNSVELSSFINRIMERGKKTVAQRIVYDALALVGEEAKARTGRPMKDRLAQELMEASRGQGAAVKRREDLHRMAEANRAFAHYRW